MKLFLFELCQGKNQIFFYFGLRELRMVNDEKWYRDSDGSKSTSKKTKRHKSCEFGFIPFLLTHRD